MTPRDNTCERAADRLGARSRAYDAPMETVATDALELEVVLERLAGHTTFEGGEALALGLHPSSDPDEVAERRARTEEALRLLELGAPAPAGARDVRQAVSAAGRGGTLDERQLAEVRATVGVALTVRERALEHAEEAPRLATALADLDAGALRGLESRLAGALDERGELADGASPDLGRLRRALSAARRAAADQLRSLTGSLAAHLQEGFVTERSGRPVLAVRAGERQAVPGIVHDSSSSGQTLFVEPFPLVEATNHVRALEGEEREERERILGALSHSVSERAQVLERAVAVLAAHDLAMAAAELSRGWGGCPVIEAAEIDLAEARHPLIDPDAVVPVDLPLSGLRALIVSGPNAGGKTVALKTLGLLAILGQCGLRVPARGARLPTFASVLTDIGDRQSIAESLSTFSAHVRTLAGIVVAAGPGTLVLLDEVAGGTDPREGAALARSVIAELMRRGATVLASTHHWELKEWAAETPEVANAAVAVDATTLTPRYELEVGHAGASHAFAIARRHGLPEEVVRASEAALESGRASAEGLLAEASEVRAAASEAKVDAEAELARAVSVREAAETRTLELESRLAGIRNEARRERDRARAEMATRLADAERELERLRREIAAARRLQDGAGAGKEAERDRRLGAASGSGRRARAALAGTAEPPRTRTAAVGDRVKDAGLGFRGVVTAVEGEDALVAGAGARVRVPLERLEVLAQAPTETTLEAPSASVRLPAAAPMATEIDVRGERAEAARASVRAFVDAAAPRAPESLRVVHGRGTGALRAAIRDELGRHPLVERWETPDAAAGGDGATIVWLGGD